jgi:hypothetical protein
MGTNFYWLLDRAVHPIVTPTQRVLPYEPGEGVDAEDPAVHIGKRSAAGPYCWDCRLTLCKEGEAGIHSGESAWHARCPRCGGCPDEEGARRAAFVELGFSGPQPARPTGVSSCASFSFAQDPEAVRAVADARPDEELVEDEYGRRYTARAFWEMVEANCPVRYTRSIGAWFC